MLLLAQPDNFALHKRRDTLIQEPIALGHGLPCITHPFQQQTLQLPLQLRKSDLPHRLCVHEGSVLPTSNQALSKCCLPPPPAPSLSTAREHVLCLLRVIRRDVSYLAWACVAHSSADGCSEAHCTDHGFVAWQFKLASPFIPYSAL